MFRGRATLISNGVLYPGSSKQGNIRRALFGRSCVAATILFKQAHFQFLFFKSFPSPKKSVFVSFGVETFGPWGPSALRPFKTEELAATSDTELV